MEDSTLPHPQHCHFLILNIDNIVTQRMTQVHCSCADATRHLIHVHKEPLAPYLLDWELARLYINKSHVLFEFSSQIDVSLRPIKVLAERGLMHMPT